MTAGKEIVAVIPKNRDADIRVIREVFKGRRIVNLRIFFVPRKGGERQPGKGIAFDEKRLPGLIAGLQEAQRRIDADPAIQGQGEKLGSTSVNLGGSTRSTKRNVKQRDFSRTVFR